MSEQISGQPAQLTFFAPTVQPLKLSEAILDAEFAEVFWPAWLKKMRRPNMGKDRAKTTFRKARKVAALAEIMAGVNCVRASPDPVFRPMASTWLNDRDWQDDAGPDLADDPWGLCDFVATLITDDGLSALSYETEALYGVLAATGWPVTWRGDLSLLNAWLAAGHTPEGISAAIAGAVAGHGSRASLRAFDGLVRARASRIDL